MAGTDLWEHKGDDWQRDLEEAKKREKEERKEYMAKRIAEDQKVQREYATGTPP